MTVEVFNRCEAGFWAFAALFVALRYGRRSTLVRRRSWIVAGLLLLFAASDLIEARTGAWWRPPGLLALKAVCVVGLVASALMLRRALRAEQDGWCSDHSRLPTPPAATSSPPGDADR
jgi:hypothetical protein